MKIFYFISILSAMLLSGCSDIAHMVRGDKFFNHENFAAAIQEYDKVIALTSDRGSPYYRLPTGEEAKKKIEIANMAIASRENLKKGTHELWQGNIQKAGEIYQEIDPQFLTKDGNASYEKNRKEILSLIALKQREETPAPQTPQTVPSETLPERTSEPPPQTVSTQAAQTEKAVLTTPEPDAAHYFPLQAGRTYHYRASIPIGKKIIYQSLDEEILQGKTMNGRTVIPFRKSQKGRGTGTLFYEVQENQILIAAEQQAGQAQPVFYEIPYVELQSPISVGSSWVAQGKSRVVLGLETVSVAAGIYQNCLKVSEHTDLIKTIRWYAPAVGLVKQQKITFPGKSYESQSVTELTGME